MSIDTQFGREEGGPHDDLFEEEGYDESQRAEILEATSGGPQDGVIIVDLDPDLGEEDEDDDDLEEDVDADDIAVDGDDDDDDDDIDDDEADDDDLTGDNNAQQA